MRKGPEQVRRGRFFIPLALLLAAALPVFPQSAWQPGHAGIGFAAPQGKQWVQMVSSARLSIQTSAHSPDLTLRFAIQTGLHINSHQPHSQFLIPTTLTFDAPSGIRIATIQYPPGVDYHFRFSPKHPLSVYAGEFSLLMPVRARPGHYTLHGQLRYQACDDRTCNPPQTLPLTLDVTAN